MKHSENKVKVLRLLYKALTPPPCKSNKIHSTIRRVDVCFKELNINLFQYKQRFRIHKFFLNKKE